MSSYHGTSSRPISLRSGRSAEGTRSLASSRLQALQDFGLRVLNLKDAVDANEDACDRLFALAHFMRDNLSGYQAPSDPDLLKNLNDALDGIFNFEAELQGDSQMRRAISTDRVKQRLEGYNRQLGDVWSRYQVDVVRYLLEIVQKSGSDEHLTHEMAPIPIDELLPVLPPDMTTYVGHEEQRQDLVDLLCHEPAAHVIVMGGPGMGKTSLATKVLYDAGVESKYTNCRFFFNCDGVITAEGIVGLLASFFNVIASRGASLQQALLNHLRALSLPILIVLDNLESAWDTDDQSAVENFLAHLCRTPLLAVMVTMRGASPPHGTVWARMCTLQPLSMQDAYSMFTQLCPDTSAAIHEHSLRELLALLDGLPLAITLLASVSLTGYTPPELLDAYREERTAMVKRGRGKDRLSNLEISIMVSMNCQTMKENPEALKLLELLALLPDGLHDNERISALPSMRSYSPAARVLVQVALCGRNEGICRVLAPIRSYIEMHHPPDQQYLQDLQQFHFHLALKGRDWDTQPIAVRNEVGPKVANIEAIVGQAIGKTADIRQLLDALLALSHFSCSVFIGDCKPYLEAAITTYQSDTDLEIRVCIAKCRQQLGEIIHRRHDYEKAATVLKEAKAAFEELGDRAGTAHSTRLLGEVMQYRSDYQRAGLLLEEARALFRELGDRHGAAECMLTLGTMMWMRADYRGSITTLKEAKATFEEVGDHRNAAGCGVALGFVLRRSDQYESAMTYLSESNAIYEAIGDRLGIARCKMQLGDVMQRLSDYTGATENATEAKRMFESLGDILGAAQSGHVLGNILLRQNNYEDARAMLKEAQNGYEAIGQPLGAAQCMELLGQVFSQTDNQDEAHVILEAARAAFEKLGDRQGLARCTMSLGGVLQSQGDYDGATAALLAARETLQDVGDRYRAAQCTRSLGRIMQAQQDYNGAIVALQEAKTVFEDIGDRLDAAKSARILGDVMRLLGDCEGAAKAFREARAAFEVIGDNVAVAQCTEMLAETVRGFTL